MTTERGSVQHGSRIDEAMADEVASLTRGAPLESRAREDLEQEPPAEGEPTPDALIAGREDDRTSTGEELPGLGVTKIDDASIELRSELARHLRPSAFPAGATTLSTIAAEEGAPDWLLDRLEELPDAATYRTVSEVWEALGGVTEHRAHPGDEPATSEAGPEAGAEPDDEAVTDAEPTEVAEVEVVETEMAEAELVEVDAEVADAVVVDEDDAGGQLGDAGQRAPSGDADATTHEGAEFPPSSGEGWDAPGAAAGHWVRSLAATPVEIAASGFSVAALGLHAIARRIRG